MARITPLHVVPALLAAATHAAEITVEAAPFHVTHHLQAVVVPVESVAIVPEAKLWRDFRVVEIAAHGSRVQTDHLLVRFDSTGVDREIEKLREEHAANSRAVEEAEVALKHLTESAPLKQAAKKLAAAQAKQDLEAFTSAGRKAAEERAAQKIKGNQQLLSRQREELTRLINLHEAGKTQENFTNTLVLRQIDEVSAAEFTLRMETLDQDRTLKVLLPREGEALAARQRESELELRQTEESIQHQLAALKSEIDSAKDAAARTERDLKLLEADRSLFEIKAPAAGWLFHGSLDGTNPGSAQPPVATFVPAAAKMSVVSLVPEASARTMAAGLEGIGTASGSPEPAVAVKVQSIGEIPSSEGKVRVEMTATWPEGFHPVPSAGFDVRFVSHRKPSAIAVPSEALSFGPNGWTVEVKLAEGNTEPRPVKPGIVSGQMTEILSGLEPGQVIRITPAAQ